MQDPSSDTDAQAPPVLERDAGGLTSAEYLIWTGQRLDPESPLYNMALAVDVRGPLDTDALGLALQRVVDGDEVLRTVFEERDGGPVRRVLDHATVGLEVVDLPESEADDDEVAELLEGRTGRLLPVDAPPLDACVIRRGAERFVLYFNQHHIATDAWSAGVLYRRWAREYGDVVAGRRSPTEHPRFADYVEHERSLRESPKLQRAVEHWTSSAQGFEQDPSMYGRTGPGSGRTERVRVPLDARRTAHLRRLASETPFRGLTAEQSHYTVFATLLLAWLHRISDRRDVAIGSPWHNRPSADLRETMGLFIELYPLRLTLDDGETLASLASKVAAETMRTIRYVVPGASGAPGARGYGAVLNYITASLGDFAGRPAEANWIHSGFGDPAHKIRLQVHDFDAGGQPTLDFDLDVEVFDEVARRWAVRHFLRLFDALTEDPNQPIARIPLVLWEEQQEFVPLARVRPEPASLLPTFRNRVEDAPEAVAVIDGGEAVAYGELARRARRIARALIHMGVRRGDAVGLCMARSANLVASMLGVLEAGAAYVPLDPGYPDGRLAFQVRDAGVGVVLVDAETSRRASEWGQALDVDATVRGAPEPVEPHGSPDPDAADLAYVLYTSGSTGRPKGVEVTHGALSDYAHWASRTYAGGEPLRFPLFTSPAFDLTLTSIFAPLLAGGTVVVYREDLANSGLLVRRVFEDGAVDVVKLTPSHLSLIRDLDLGACRVRKLIVGGEDLKVATARRILDAFGGELEIYNEYGPTEATVACALHRFDPDTDTGSSMPIGRPADNASIHVLDDAGHPVPRGVRGEICVTGPRVARGYRGLPERSARAFVTVPETPGRPMYRTGDVGRWSAKGPLEFLGRRDEQVKVRGARLELGEVEAALHRHPRVIEAAARVARGQASRSEHCAVCGLEGAHPEAFLDADRVCGPCRRFEAERERVARYFGTMGQLSAILEEAARSTGGPDDTLMLYSGGKDSTYALCRIVDMGARPLVFTLDNGFISEEAKSNVRRVVDQLDLELVVGETPAMPEIFKDSLTRFSNVCNGCFKTIYTLALNLALERGIETIVTGLSRGQIFETRLADLYRRGIYDPEEVDRTILEARKAYHGMDDAVRRNLDVSAFDTDEALERIRFVDFYRYCDDTLDEVLAYVAEHTPWIRPSDTGRSTNCLINEAGIFVHTTERGFHNYTLPYSWDVRLGHKRREAALAELDDDLDPAAIRRMLDEVGYREREAPPAESRLMAYYTADEPVPVSELRRFLSHQLPGDAMPSVFLHLDAMPLTANGKVDRDALPLPPDERPVLEGAFVAPRTSIEDALAEIWGEVLGLQTVGVHDDFFELGGDSMHCIQIVSLARGRGLGLSPRDVFAHPTVAGLASVAGEEPAGATAVPAASASLEELAELEEELGG